jgi:RND family efflux transporter MFP subunit
VKHTRRYWAIPVFVAAALSVGVFVAGCGSSSDGVSDGNGALTAQLVQVGAPVVRDAVRILTVNGDIRSERRVTLTPQVSGRLVARPVNLGDTVRSGGIIASVDHEQIDLAVAQARAAHSSATEQAENLQAELDRAQQLYDAGGASRQHLDQIRTQTRAAAEGVNQAQAALDQALINRREANVRAPFDGVVGRLMVETGDMVSPGVPVAIFVALDPLKAVVRIPERDLALISAGQPVELIVAAYPDETFSGTVQRISPLVDEMTRMVEVEIRVPNTDHRLKPGMFATTSIEVGRHENAVMIPSDALLQESRLDRESLSGAFERIYYVFLSEDGRAVRRNVEIGYMERDEVEIRTGISARDTIITRGHHLVRDGQPIEIASPDEIGRTAS